MNKNLAPYFLAAGALIFVAVFAEFLTPFDPFAQDLEGALSPPNSVNWLGTDRYGRDILSRVIMGSQTTLCASLILLAVIASVGSLIGAVCGYAGGRLDTVLMRLSDVFLAFPQMVFAIAMAGALGGGLLNAVMALAVIGWTKYARIARSLTLTIRSMPYFDAARISGGKPLTILRRHVLPNIGNGGAGYWHDNHGTGGLIVLRAGRAAANAGVGLDDEQRALDVTNCAVGDFSARLCDFFNGGGFQLAGR